MDALLVNKSRSTRFRLTVSIITLILPWPIKRLLLNSLLGYQIDSGARIGYSLIFPKALSMAYGSKIGNLNVCKGLGLLQMGQGATIGNLNWITAVPLESLAYRGEVGRRPQLLLQEQSAITNRHLIDCTNVVTLGRFSTFAGFRSQILTHAINLQSSRQESAPVSIGAYCFVGTNVVILAGASLPDHSVLAASATLAACYDAGYTLYGGVPAKPIKQLSPDMEYFKRPQGFVR